MKLDNLYMVESPLQALCALEVALSLPNETHGVILILSDSSVRVRNNEQMLEVISMNKWDYILEIDSYSNVLLRHLHYSYMLRMLYLKFSREVKRFYIGEFRSVFMHQARSVFKAKEDALLDDGTVTVEMVDKFLSRGIYYHPSVRRDGNIVKKIIHDFIYLGIVKYPYLERDLNVYSAYKLQLYDKKRDIDFTNIRERVFSQSRIKDGVVYFYGSKYSEAGILNLNDELKFLSGVREYYSGKDVLYFAHRDESIEKLDIIKGRYGFEVLIPDEMAELYLMKSDFLPEEVSSACSSVLVNVDKLFPEIKLTSFYLDMNKITRDDVGDGIELAYKYFESVGIPVVKI